LFFSFILAIMLFIVNFIDGIPMVFIMFLRLMSL
jgi:hypothetical protein